MSKKLTKINVPEEYEEKISDLVNMMLLAEKRKEQKEKLYEVVQIISHKVVNGLWSFLCVFSDGAKEWVNDSDLQYEGLVKEYAEGLPRPFKTVYCICRVSSLSQVGPKHVSLDAQENRLRQVAKQFGENSRVKVLKLSASAYKGIPRLLEDIGESATEGDAILVYRVDRISRNIVKFLDFLERTAEKGVAIYSQDEKLYYNGDTKLAFIQGILEANKEAELISRRVKMSIQQRRNRGDKVFGSLSYGYKSQRGPKGELLRVKNEKEQKVIESIRKSVKAGEKLVQIANALNSKGILKRGRKWTPSMVRYLVRS